MVRGEKNNFSNDERFAHIATDPRFKTLKRSEQRIKADARWRSMLEDERFTHKATAVDKRGRPKYTSMKEDLRRIYDISGSSSEEESDTDVHSESDNEASEVNVKAKKLQKPEDVSNEIDIARGQGLEDSSDDDSSDEDDTRDEPDAEVEHPWGEMDKDAEKITDPTSRLAVCNMDWDRIRAVDLLMLFNSFKPETGVVKSVSIYPSEYGMQRLQEEEKYGPLELRELPAKGNDDEGDGDDGAEYHREKLRRYELNRLRYYYAVVECDSAETANILYERCDGTEFENSASRLDLRFIPEDMTFDQKPKSTASSVPDAAGYQPPVFTGSALQCSSVKLTWDETPHERMEFMARNFSKDELADQDLAAYIASDTDSDEDPYGGDNFIDDSEWQQTTETAENNVAGSDDDDDTSRIEKFKSLVRDLHDKKGKKQDEDFEMEVTWEPGLKEKTEKKLKEKKDKSKKMTPWEEYREKKKRKRLEKKEARLAKKKHKNEESSSPEASNDEKPKKKKKTKQVDKKKKNKLEEKLKVDAVVTDSRFSAVYENPRFNIDQSAPEYRQSDMMEAILAEKVKRRTTDK